MYEVSKDDEVSKDEFFAKRILVHEENETTITLHPKTDGIIYSKTNPHYIYLNCEEDVIKHFDKLRNDQLQLINTNYENALRRFTLSMIKHKRKTDSVDWSSISKNQNSIRAIHFRKLVI